MRCLLIGNYGVGNLGDELLREYFLKNFPEVEWIVFTHGTCDKGQGTTPRLPLGLRSFFGTPWCKTLRAYWTADAVVFGGGSLFTDIESPKACVLWWWHAFVAWIFRKPIYLAFQGIGPFKTTIGGYAAGWVLRRAKFLSVRDAASKMRAWSLNPNILCVQSFDPVFLLFSGLKMNNQIKNVFTVVPRKNTPDNFTAVYRNILDSGTWDAVRFLSLEPGSADEQSVIQILAALSTVPSERKNAKTSEDLRDGIADSKVVLTQRYHAGIAALAMRKEVHIVPQAPGDKLSQLPQGRLTDTEYGEHEELARRGERALRDALMSVPSRGHKAGKS